MSTLLRSGALCEKSRRLVARLAVALLAIAPTAALPATQVSAANPGQAAAPAHGSARELHQDALQKLPLNKLTPQGRSIASKVLNDTTIFRRLPQQTIECRPELFLFLVEHPEMVINMWEVLGVTNVTIKKIGPTSYHIDDGQGTSGDIHFLYKSPTQHIVFCEGTYTGTLMPRAVRGRCVISLRTAHLRDTDDTDFMQCRLDSFVQLDNIGVEVFARTFQSMIGGIADHNFKETTGFVSSVSVAAESAPENLHRIAGKCRRVSPEVKNEFLAISDRIYSAAMGLSPGEAEALSASRRAADGAAR